MVAQCGASYSQDKSHPKMKKTPREIMNSHFLPTHCPIQNFHQWSPNGLGSFLASANCQIFIAALLVLAAILSVARST
jgi:hypothetical protein